MRPCGGGAQLGEQIFTAEIVGQAEGLPPIGQVLIHLAHIGAQTHEIKTSTEAHLLNQGERGATAALFKTGLHHPNFAHVCSQLSPARYIANSGFKDLVDGLLQSGKRRDSFCQAQVPTGSDISP